MKAQYDSLYFDTLFQRDQVDLSALIYSMEMTLA